MWVDLEWVDFGGCGKCRVAGEIVVVYGNGVGVEMRTIKLT